MKLLFDECVSRLLKPGFAVHGYECFTVPEVGLAGRKNGELLTLAEGKFDVFVTIDKNIRYQQNLSGRRIAILIIRADRQKSMTFFASYRPVLLHFNLSTLAKSSKLDSNNSYSPKTVQSRSRVFIACWDAVCLFTGAVADLHGRLFASNAGHLQ